MGLAPPLYESLLVKLASNPSYDLNAFKIRLISLLLVITKKKASKCWLFIGVKQSRILFPR